MLAGLRSRWTTPRLCANSSALAICGLDHRYRIGERKTAAHAVGQHAATEIFHRDVGDVVVADDVVHRNDVPVRQLRERTALEQGTLARSCSASTPGSKPAAHHLDRDLLAARANAGSRGIRWTCRPSRAGAIFRNRVSGSIPMPSPISVNDSPIFMIALPASSRPAATARSFGLVRRSRSEHGRHRSANRKSPGAKSS